MGNYLSKGTTFADGGPCNAALLNAHVDEAIIKATAISSQTLKDPSALSDEILINDGGTLKKTTLQQLHNLILYTGCVVQTAYGEYTANTNLSIIIPEDDTIPQNTEGTEILSVSITPRFSTSTILVSFVSSVGHPSTNNAAMIAALFRDSIVGALAATELRAGISVTQLLGGVSITHMDSPATTSSVTYKIRAGAGVGTMRLNGQSGSRLFGGVAKCTLTLQEIKV